MPSASPNEPTVAGSHEEAEAPAGGAKRERLTDASSDESDLPLIKRRKQKNNSKSQPNTSTTAALSSPPISPGANEDPGVHKELQLLADTQDIQNVIQDPALQETEDELLPEEELAGDEDDLLRQQVLGNRATNPMELHEIRVNVARFLGRRELRSCLLVSGAWWESFAPFLWRDLRPVYNNVLGVTQEYPQAKLMRKYGHWIKTFEYNGHGLVLQSMLPNNRGYTDVGVDWRKARQEELDHGEAHWMYADEDVDPETPFDPDATLSDFEELIEKNRLDRLEQNALVKSIREANLRQNMASRFLNDNTEYRDRTCNQIERLIITEKRFSRERGCHYRNWIKLMQINQDHLRCLEMTFLIRSADAHRDVFQQIVALKNLEELVLVGNDIDTAKMKPFIEEVCVRLTRLELKDMRIDYNPSSNQYGGYVNNNQLPVLTKMKSLSLITSHELNGTFIWKFLAVCPNVVQLEFRAKWSVSMEEFSKTLSTKLPNVTHLGFWAPRASDMDLSKVFKALPTIQSLDVSGCVFGLIATNVISTKHLITITYLDVRNCRNLTGPMIARILGESRHLRSFLADFISGKDMVCSSLYPYWGCIGLRELVIDIRGDPSDKETSNKVYNQLSCLTFLEHLDISKSPVQSNTSTTPQGNLLTLGLSSGLKTLRTLVHMKRLVFREVKNDVGLAEILWMAKAWPLLGEIGGKITSRKLALYNPNIILKEGQENVNGEANRSCECGASRATQDGHATTMCPCAPRASRQNHDTTIPNGTPLPSTAALPVLISSPQGFTPTLPTKHVRGTSRSEQMPRLLLSELRRLGLHHRIKVISHREDKMSLDQRKRFRHLVNDSDEDDDRMRPTQPDPRYRHDFREW